MPAGVIWVDDVTPDLIVLTFNLGRGPWSAPLFAPQAVESGRGS